MADSTAYAKYSGVSSSVISGTVAIANGGTGQTTKAAAFDALSPMTTGGDLIYGGASGTGTRLANGTAGQVLTSAGTTAAPTWTTLSAPNSNIYADTGNGYGGTNTKIRRFTNQTTVGTDITYADSAANGATFTINTTGIYTIDRSDSGPGTADVFGVSLNSAQLTTNIQSITTANRLQISTAETGDRASLSCTVRCVATDVLRAHDAGTMNSTTATCLFRITRIA